MDQSFSTNPVRGPIPVWNQTFSLPVRTFDAEVNFELLKYEQYKTNESFGEFRLFLNKLALNPPLEEIVLTASTGIDLKIKTEFIPKRHN